MPKKNASAPRQVRIIGGQWKRTPLPVAHADGLRPTPDRVRETVFNWLDHLQGGRWRDVHCLDLFAGTGALGFEAASRGAAQVLMVESNPQALQLLTATRDKLDAQQLRVVRGDALKLAASMAERFHLIFLDPPYQLDLLPRLLPLCRPLLERGGLVYAEAASSLQAEPLPSWLAGWKVIRADKAGMVHYALLQPDEGQEN